MLATTLADRRKVGLGKSVVPDERIVSVWESKQAGALGWRRHAATWQNSALYWIARKRSPVEASTSLRILGITKAP